MKSELYFDISSESSGGSIYKTREESGEESFLYSYSNYDDDNDDIKVYKTAFASFKDFWGEITKNREWFYLHPLYVHPEVREFIQQELQKVDWTVEGDFKWQESHKRQWKKVLTDPGSYYRSNV